MVFQYRLRSVVAVAEQLAAVVPLVVQAVVVQVIALAGLPAVPVLQDKDMMAVAVLAEVTIRVAVEVVVQADPVKVVPQVATEMVAPEY
jgi:hypothetical protein